jgi:serine/threonine protein kinase
MAILKAGSRIGPYPYRIVKQLGNNAGNMSDVYLATVGAVEPVTPSDLVVLKISKATGEHEDFFKDTIYNESERLRQLRHPGIVRILPIQTDNPMRQLPYAARATLLPNSPWFLVLEYLSGNSLTDLLQRHGKFQPLLALKIARSLAETLDYIHRQDQVHLDIKPENILFRYPIESGGRIEPVLIDFGIARNTGQEGLEARTLFYAPPERVQLSRGNLAPERSPRPQPSMDVYSLGVVLYQMITGRRPFDGRTDKGISSAILAGNPTKPSQYSGDVTQPIELLILETMAREPLNRPTAGELVQHLETMLAKTNVNQGAKEAAPIRIGASRTWRLRQRLRPALWAVAVLLLFVVVLQTVSILQTGQTWPASQPGIAAGLQQLVDRLMLIGDTQVTPTPRPTTTPVAEPTQVAVAVTVPATATATPEPSPTFTAAPSATPTRQATATQAPTWTPTPVPTVKQRAATSTPVQDPPTATAITPAKAQGNAGAMSTPVPEHTRPPTATATPPPVNTKPPASPPPTNTPKVQRSVNLIAPGSGDSGKGKVEFRWQANFTPGPGQAFEPIFWRDGQDPFVSGLGWGGTTQATTLLIDLDTAAPDNYLWGVLLVETNPYKRVQYLGGGWRYNVQGSGQSSDNGSSSRDQ